MDIFAEVREIIVESLGSAEDSVVEEARVKEDLGADSLAVVELIMALEDRFEISIPEEKIAEIATVGDIVTLISGLK